MSDILIINIDRIVSGDLQQPFVDGDAVVIRQGHIAEIGYQGQMFTDDIE